MKRILKTLLVILSCLVSGQSSSQPNQQHFEKIPATLLQEDLQTLKDSLDGFHPGMYRYTNETSLNQLFDSTINVQTHALSTINFYATIRYLLSAVKDGHTEASLPETIRRKLKSETKMFPVNLHFNADKAYLPCGAVGLPAGTEILAIDNTPIPMIREKLFQHIRSDGDIRTKKYWDINFGDRDYLS